MRIVCIYYEYPPFLLAGSEVGAHEINKFLKGKGHEVVVYTNNRGLDEYEGIQLRYYDPGRITVACKTADWIFSQFQWSPFAAEKAAQFKKKAMVFFHTSTSYGTLNNPFKFDQRLHICYNSNVLRQQINYRHPYFILNPFVDEERVKIRKHDPRYVTLINCGQNKGGDFLVQLAKRMPEVDFMGVQGGYSKQIMDLESENIQYVAKTNNPRLIYEQTKILIVPSAYESWGRVVHEAMLNGIPVIATPNPGVMECGGEAVVYCERISTVGWEREITKLLTDKKYYTQRAKAGLKRAAQLNTKQQLHEFENYLTENR